MKAGGGLGLHFSQVWDFVKVICQKMEKEIIYGKSGRADKQYSEYG